MSIKTGMKVRTPDGRNGRVRQVNPQHTGRVGRPALLATVQMVGTNGKLIKQRKKFKVRELQAA